MGAAVEQLGSTANMLALTHSEAARARGTAATPLQRAHHTALSLAYARIALRVRPDHGGYHTNAGAVYGRAGLAAAALRHAARAVELEPGSGVHWFNLGHAQEAAGEVGGAAFARAAELLPGHPQLRAKAARYVGGSSGGEGEGWAAAEVAVGAEAVAPLR